MSATSSSVETKVPADDHQPKHELHQDRELKNEPDNDPKPEPEPAHGPEPGSEAQPITFPEGGLRAWLALAGAFSAMFCTFGYLSAFGVYEAYYHDKILIGSSHSEIAWIGSLQSFFMCSAGLISGPLVDRYGSKMIFIPFSLLYVLSVMFTSLCHEYYQFILAQGILGGICIGMLYTPSVSILGHYFNRRRDLAIGISSAGSPLGGIIFPIALLRMLEYSDIGFGWAVRVIGFINLALLVIVCTTLTPRIAPRRGPHFLLAAFKNPVYIFQLLGYCLVFWGIYTPFFFLPSYAIAQGVSIDWQFYIMPIYNSGSFVGRIIGSRITQHMGRFNTLIAAMFLSAILLYCWQAATTLGGIIAFAVLFGFTSGAIIGLFPTTVAATAPHPNQIGTYLGMTMGGIGVFGLTGPPMVGAMVNRYGGYTEAIVFSGSVCMASAVLVTIARFFHAGKTLIA